jgi:ankyrin repeat protein
MMRLDSKYGCLALVLFAFPAAGLDRIEARHDGSSTSTGFMSGAIDFQFRVSAYGTLDQKIEQTGRELRLLQFARDSFPVLLSEVSYSGTNRLMSQCLADLSRKIGKSIPMEAGTNDFKTGEFVFTDIPLVDALKYLVAFDDSILDVSDGKLLRRPLRQALCLDQSQYDLLKMMSSGQFEAAERILAGNPANVGRIRDTDGQTFLHLAAWHNQTSIAKRLISLGADINAKDNAGYTQLHEAVRFGNRECARLLLKNGADPNIPDNNNDRPLGTAVYYGFTDLAKTLVDHGAALDICSVSALGMVDRVRSYLDDSGGRNAGQQEFLGYYRTDETPLHWAARGGSVEVARLLISRGESVSAKDGNGDTPPFWAATEGRLKTAKFLVKHGADVNATNNSVSTPLLTAARSAVAPDLIRFLLKAGANVNARDNEGENALHKLAWYGYPAKNIEAARILLAAGADMNATNYDGKTPLDVLLDNSLRNGGLVKLYRDHAGKTSPGNAN